MFRVREISALIVVMLTAHFGYQYTQNYVITGLLITILDNVAYYTPDVIVMIKNKRKEHKDNKLQVVFQHGLDLILYEIQSASWVYMTFMVLFAPMFHNYYLWVFVSFIIANCLYYFRIRYHNNLKVQLKVSERCARYIPSELSATVWALASGNLTMRLSGGNHFLASIIISWVDNLMYYGVMIYREAQASRKEHGHYSFKLFTKDLRNLLIEFWPAELIQTLIIYPLFLTYIPKLFDSYSFGVVVGMIIANSFFYRAVIPVYERRKKHFVK